ncbi:hypothetical protein L4D77_06065 [Photobacterium frigidiphilum]|uniref:hypothetical protein n=1 Tax=Photobacterium frigidiphilum TaxID=264736 RepID=UPI003D14DFF7
MEKTAKEHFKAMYGAVRNDRFPSSIAFAALDASDDFDHHFAVKIAVAARQAAEGCLQRDLTLRLMIFKCSKTEPF